MLIGRPKTRRRPSTEELLPHSQKDSEMDNLDPGKRQAQVEHAERPYTDDAGNPEASSSEPVLETNEESSLPPEYKVYKRRFFGLFIIVLLNIIVSWDWLSYSAISPTTAQFFSTDTNTINWLSTAFLFAFLFAAPVSLYTLSTHGPRLAIVLASILILFGNWIRYAGTRTHTPSFGLTMTGQIFIGFAQPFVLSAPTCYSDLWFSPRGRVSATAIMSLANPFGGALAQLIDPFLATTQADIPNTTLYIAIFSSAATIPSFFVPAGPPTPASPSAVHAPPPLRKQISLLMRSVNFWLLLIPFATYVGLFNSFSSLLAQILVPYDFSETESGIAGGLLILVGLVTAAVTSPIIDRSKRYLLLIKCLVPVIAICYFAFIWAPPTRSAMAPYLICSILGAASFSLVPVALEWLVEATWPVRPEVGSVICWAGGQALGGIFIIVSDALQDGADASPPFKMGRALIFQAVVACAAVPFALALGLVGGGTRNRRLEIDKAERGGGRDGVEEG